MRDIVWQKYKSEKNRQCYKYQKFVSDKYRTMFAFRGFFLKESKGRIEDVVSIAIDAIDTREGQLAGTEIALLTLERVSSIFKVLRIC